MRDKYTVWYVKIFSNYLCKKYNGLFGMKEVNKYHKILFY